jgi:DNA-binding beta-propeller fold protein YncE
MTEVKRAARQRFIGLLVKGPVRRRALCAIALFCALPSGAQGVHGSGPKEHGPVELSTGKYITPNAATGAIFQDLFKPDSSTDEHIPANQASAIAVAPDGKMLAILTSGWNFRFVHPDGRNPMKGDYAFPGSEYVYLFDISGARPKQVQVLQVPRTWQGLAWAPTSDRLFVAGGTDDRVLEFVRTDAGLVGSRTFALGHQAGLGVTADLGGAKLDVKPMAGALAISPDGTELLVANFQNDSVSLISLTTGRVVAEQDLRPGKIDIKERGKAGGSYPRAVAWISSNRAYVASERDHEIISLQVAASKVQVASRIAVHGQPIAMIANRAGSRIYAALDNTDKVAIVDTKRDRIVEEFSALAPQSIYSNKQQLGGANSNALALTPDEDTLLVSNGGENDVAVVRLSQRAQGTEGQQQSHPEHETERSEAEQSSVIGLVPTGYYPTGVATSKVGATWYVVNAKSETGANSSWCGAVDPSRGTCIVENPDPISNSGLMLSMIDQFNGQLQRAGFLAFPAPSGRELARLTKQVAHNNHFDNPALAANDQKLFAFLHEHIHHVIYVIKENRTYDQILGDLSPGNGDPRLNIFPDALSPNHHAIARNFVTLDNFLLSGEGSWTGWDFSTAARNNDFRVHQEPATVHGGMLGDEWGANRNINMGLATSDERHAERAVSPSDPDLLPGIHDVGAPDGPGGEEGRGYIWDAALRAGLAVRNYGFFGMLDWSPPLVRDPSVQGLRVFYPTKPALMPVTDPY